MKSKQAVEKRLERYIDEKKTKSTNRNWENGYILGMIDALRWVINGVDDE